MNVLSSYVIVNFVDERLLYLFNTLVTIDLSELVLLSVVVEQLDGLIEVDDQSPAHCFSSIVGALVELTPIQITNIGHLGGTKFGVVYVLICLAEDSACKPLK